MEDTGEIVHVRPKDLRGLLNGNRDNRKHTYYEDEDTESDLDQGKAQRPDRAHNSQPPVDDDDTESDLDQGVSRVTPGKKSGKMGIMRRKGVSKTKGSPYRSSGSSHDEDASPLVANQLVGGAHMQRRNGKKYDYFYLDCI